MAEILIQPGGDVPNIQSNARYNIPSQIGALAMEAFDLRSGVDPIIAAGLLSHDGASQLSALSSQGRLEKTSVDSALSALGAGEIALVDEFTIAVGTGSVTSVASLHIQYQAQGERKRVL